MQGFGLGAAHIILEKAVMLFRGGGLGGYENDGRLWR